MIICEITLCDVVFIRWRNIVDFIYSFFPRVPLFSLIAHITLYSLHSDIRGHSHKSRTNKKKKRKSEFELNTVRKGRMYGKFNVFEWFESVTFSDGRYVFVMHESENTRYTPCHFIFSTHIFIFKRILRAKYVWSTVWYLSHFFPEFLLYSRIFIYENTICVLFEKRRNIFSTECWMQRY